LSLTNKLAALHAQHQPDPVIIDGVNDIEDPTTNLRTISGRRLPFSMLGEPSRATYSDREFR